MISFKDAFSRVMERVPSLKIRRLRLESAHRRIIAQDIYASSDAPDFDKSVMDGFAVRFGDLKTRNPVLKIVEFIPAGFKPKKRLTKGTCARIATGAVVPVGADLVVAKEDARIERNNTVLICKKARRGENIYQRASGFKKGALLLKKGQPLNMARIALLASQGIRSVSVFQAPAVALLATGDEIIEPGQKRRQGGVWNSSSPMLLDVLRTMNIKARYLGLAKDEQGDLLGRVKSGLKEDILIITGAVSVGERDLVPQVLKKAGVKILFHKVCIRPGKPVLFGSKGRHLVFGLPGNPVSTMVGFLVFIKPLLQRLCGVQKDFRLEEGILTKEVYNKSGRLSFLPATLKRENLVVPLAYSGSADLLAAAGADAFFVLAPNETRKPRNSRVKFLKIVE